MRKWLWLIPLFLLLECALRPIDEPDIFFYFAIVQHYLQTGVWPTTDPFVYTVPTDHLMTLHQWLGYWIYYSVYPRFGWSGPIVLMTAVLCVFFASPLIPFVRRARPAPVFFPLLWSLAIFAAHHRFRERVSLFGDLAAIALVSGLYWCAERRWFWYALPVLFLTWAQLHPSYPLGWVVLIVYAATHKAWTWPRHRWIGLSLCFAAPFLNPMGFEGVLYPFRFSWSIEPYLRQYIVEWLPLTDPRLYAFRFLYLPLLTLIPFAAWKLWRERKTSGLFDVFILILATALTLKSVRFGLMAEGLLLIVFSALELRRTAPATTPGWKLVGASALASLAVVTTKVYLSPKGLRPLAERFRIDDSYFPEKAVDALNANKPHMRVFNSFGYGGYLAFRWQGDPPIFFHGFSTNFKFYEDNYYYPQASRATLDPLIAKWDIGVFLLSKLGNDNNFIRILAEHPDWQLVYQDAACVIFAKRDPRVFGGPHS